MRCVGLINRLLKNAHPAIWGLRVVYLEYILVVSTGCDDDVSYSLQHVFSSAHATDDLKSGECHRRHFGQVEHLSHMAA